MQRDKSGIEKETILLVALTALKQNVQHNQKLSTRLQSVIDNATSAVKDQVDRDDMISVVDQVAEYIGDYSSIEMSRLRSDDSDLGSRNLISNDGSEWLNEVIQIIGSHNISQSLTISAPK